jgi:ribonuclease P protein component
LHITLKSGSSNEAYISTQQAYTKETPRIPSADAHQGRAFGYQIQESEGPQAPGCLEDVAACTGQFQKHRRLSGPAEFQRVFKTSSRSADSQFLVLASENGLSYSRLGLAVSKEKLKKAVSRNRFKRLVRESFRANSTLLSGLDLVVLPQTRINMSDKQALRDSLSLHWRKVSR